MLVLAEMEEFPLGIFFVESNVAKLVTHNDLCEEIIVTGCHSLYCFCQPVN